jgi:uncharacterized membrane protein
VIEKTMFRWSTNGSLHFVAAVSGAFVFAALFANLVPGGNDDIKWLIGVALFIAGEIAVCTNSIIERLDKKYNRSKDNGGN